MIDRMRCRLPLALWLSLLGCLSFAGAVCHSSLAAAQEAVGDAAAPSDETPAAGDATASDPAASDPAATDPAAGDPAAGDSQSSLAVDQAQVAQRFKRLEELLLKSSEIESASNPARAALLQQAAQLGKQSQVSELLARAAKSLDQKQYSQAVEDQKISRDSLKRLLELLQSENRQDRVREERDQVRRWIEETDRLLRLQSSLRGRTEGGQKTDKAASDQAKLADKAGQIAKELEGDQPQPEGAENQAAENEAAETDGEPSKEGADPKLGEPKASEPKPSEPKPSEPKPSEPKPSEPKPSSPSEGNDAEGSPPGDTSKETEASDGDDKAGEQSPDDKPGDQPEEKAGDKPEDKSGDKSDSESADKPEASEPSEAGKESSKPSDAQAEEGKPSESPSPSGESQPQSGEQQSGEPQSGEQPSQQTPPSPTQQAAERIKRAQQRMNEAQEKLDEAEREGAVEKQRQAEQELQAAMEQLEEILRQLREEEIERSLAALEARLRTMLQAQNNVLEETERLQEIGGDQADRQVAIRASNLSVEERKILAEGQRALLLLREEGTSAAFPEAMSQVLIDVQSVVDRLAQADTGKLTVSIEKEIVSSLEEMVEALVAVQKDQKKRKEQKQSPGQQPQGQPGEQPLVDQLAELRLIRTLQLRVNKRTQSLSEVLKDPNDAVGQADAEDVSAQLRSLAERQASIQEVTRDIVVGKTK